MLKAVPANAALAVFLCCGAALVSGCSEDPESVESPKDQVATEGPETSDSSVNLTQCRDLPALPKDTQINTSIDLEGGLLTFAFLDPDQAVDQVYTVDFEQDWTCASHQSVLELVREAKEAATGG